MRFDSYRFDLYRFDMYIIDLNDMDTQEMLVKNFIYFDNTEEVNVNYLDIRTSANGGKVININGTTTTNRQA